MMNAKEIEKLIAEGYSVNSINVNARKIEEDDKRSSYNRRVREGYVKRLSYVSVELIRGKDEYIRFECTYDDLFSVSKDLVNIGYATTTEGA